MHHSLILAVIAAALLHPFAHGDKHELNMVVKGEKGLDGKMLGENMAAIGGLNEHTEQVKGGGREKRSILENSALLWPDGIIKVLIDPLCQYFYDHPQKAIIRYDMALWNYYTCIQFEEISEPPEDNENYVLVTCTNITACGSTVGHASSAPQHITVHPSACFQNIGTLIHELGHVIGLQHEQTRPDRDSYISLNNDNILSASNYEIKADTSATCADYDYSSIMHYNIYQYAVNGAIPTMTAASPSEYAWRIMGQLVQISFNDISNVNCKYCPCNGSPTGVVCQNGGFLDGEPDENNAICNRCKCPEGWTGATCEQVQPSSSGCDPDGSAAFIVDTQTETCVTTPGYGYDGVNVGVDNTCYWYLQVDPLQPQCKIDVRIDALGIFDYQGICYYHWLELRTRNAYDLGERFCSASDNGAVRTTVGDDAMILFGVRGFYPYYYPGARICYKLNCS